MMEASVRRSSLTDVGCSDTALQIPRACTHALMEKHLQAPTRRLAIAMMLQLTKQPSHQRVCNPSVSVQHSVAIQPHHRVTQ